MEAHSGHYLPTPDNFRKLISSLTNSGADLTVAKVSVAELDPYGKPFQNMVDIWVDMAETVERFTIVAILSFSFYMFDQYTLFRGLIYIGIGTFLQVHLESEEEIAKRAPGKNERVSSVDNEKTFLALLASAGFTIRSDSNARFTKCDSEREDLFAAALPEVTPR